MELCAVTWEISLLSSQAVKYLSLSLLDYIICYQHLHLVCLFWNSVQPAFVTVLNSSIASRVLHHRLSSDGAIKITIYSQSLCSGHLI